jgi:predicted nucleic acid-binding protein
VKGLFDANAIVNLTANEASAAIDATRGGSALNLTFFEIGNSVWKTHQLLKKLSLDEARSLLEVSIQLLARLEILNLTREDALQIMELANTHGITFYDSSYLYASKKNKLSLITDDARLGRVAQKEKVETLSSVSTIRNLL